MNHIPKTAKALVLRKAAQASKPVYHDAVLEDLPLPELKPGHVLVRIHAAAFNHRDHWVRKGMYPGIGFGSVLGGDGAGVVVASTDKSDELLRKRVVLVPMRGWERDQEAPESRFFVLGGSNANPLGTFAQYVVVERDQIIPIPDHLDDVHAAAWPIGAVTAWRATMVNGAVKQGDSVLITGIGGGVALTALQLCVARGANVYVTSGGEDKIRKAVALGAKGGVSYKADDWPKQLAGLLKKNGASALSVVIDAGGGDIMGKTSSILKPGGRVVVFGMHASPTVTMTMREVMRNQKLIGSTMGSKQDLIDATNFLAQHRIVPVVSEVLDGLESAERGFQILENGEQFGKIVIRVADSSPKAVPAKL
ncbi:NAD-P-binding protein [Trametes versicolor FP-101664 SS1]|uniref:NAD-P-binding protein n=1 Tax=Trametes versicolor (strain FP-101664) TaxID=717944 RepID=UPI0004623057|nr:NAD-P-binding protein [Trametes versicolor FP-101664 SS1]EIW60533.1 NAD-P-binding protein [Trametes versicolor FP-101664 SS1]